MEYPVEYLKWSTPKNHVYWSNKILYQHGEPFRRTYLSFIYFELASSPIVTV